MNVRALAACTLLAGISAGAPAWAQETPPPDAVTARPPVVRFDDELPEVHEAARLLRSTDARTEPSDAGQLVAHLPRTAIVTRLATRGDAELVAFDDPEDASRTVSGWVPVKAFTAPTLSARAPLVRRGRGPDEPSRGYASQTLAVDGLAIVLVIASPFTIGRVSQTMFWATFGLGLATYGLGPPIVHWAHDNRDAGLGSLAMRLLAGGVGMASIVAVGIGGSAWFLLGVAGVAVPPIVDAAVLAYEKAPATRPRSQTWLMPTVAPTKGGATLGLVGSF